jgi:hypothetical protein
LKSSVRVGSAVSTIRSSGDLKTQRRSIVENRSSGTEAIGTAIGIEGLGLPERKKDSLLQKTWTEMIRFSEIDLQKWLKDNGR